MAKLKTYKIQYKRSIDWHYVAKNPDNPWDLANMNESVLVSRNCGEFEEVVEATNKKEAKAMLAVHVAHMHTGIPYSLVLPIVRDAYRGITDVTEVL